MRRRLAPRRVGTAPISRATPGRRERVCGGLARRGGRDRGVAAKPCGPTLRSATPPCAWRRGCARPTRRELRAREAQVAARGHPARGRGLQSVAIDGRPQPIRQVERKVVLPIRPGAHAATLSWRTPAGYRLYRTPQIGVGAPAVNVELG
jgi:hypothetical protein